jgi:hypothetical protein
MREIQGARPLNRAKENTMANNEHGCYAVIPAAVRYDRTICNGAKLLYGEIAALAGKDGVCKVESGYFANAFDLADDVIRHWISALQRRGYVRITAHSPAHDELVLISSPTAW